ncbi:hypothetical protein Shal_1476 [Shewanella halifaxensis HAW-EB4]|uniref:Uncharacterized protein n=2 Tax=Shewanella halifaxensis TaxID=271098 RepID=B0TMH3_SHEHH|nr:hypothetical protein Shal_1476 [Shewanella halifaxensis HAW-EB4]
MSKSGLSVNLLGQQYSLKTVPPIPLQQLKQAQNFLLNIVQINGTIAQSTLFALGGPISLPLPQALLAAISRSKAQEKKLQQLAKRKDGYPLPTAKVKGSQLRFDKGPSFVLERLCTSKQGEYTATIRSVENQLLLELSPIHVKAKVNLISTQDVSKELADLATDQPAERIQHLANQKTDVNFQYRNLFKSLEAIDENVDVSLDVAADAKYPSPDKERLGQSHSEAGIAPTPATSAHLLADALEKAGGLPGNSPAMSNVKENAKESLASALLRVLPRLSPETLIELSQPQRLKQVIMATINQSLSPNDWLSTPLNTHVNTLNLLFQLLLGRASASQITPELAKKLSILQAHLALPEPLLKLLESCACQESLSKLLSNLNLYQHASSRNEQMINYYFAIPYSISHYQEQLEGHIQKEKQSNNPKNDVWRLQLKFNLASGPLLIGAQTLKHDNPHSSAPLKLKFSCSNEAIINKIELLTPSLSQKLEGIGFSQISISTKQENIPATILPGEHYLVKVDV